MFRLFLNAALGLSLVSSLWAQSPQVTPPEDKQIFDLFLLVGQSNMAGRGKVEEADRQPDPCILSLDAADQWVCKGQPIHFDKPIAGTGLGFAFAKEVTSAEPGKTVGLIPCAVGGTPIREWLPGQKLYTDAVKRARLAQQNGTLRAILWHQGESDANRQDIAEAYGQNLKAVLEGFRKDLNAPDLPIIVGGLGDFTFNNRDGLDTFAPLINQQIEAVAKELPHVYFVSSQGLKDKGDHLHFDTASLNELGLRYYQAYQKVMNR